MDIRSMRSGHWARKDIVEVSGWQQRLTSLTTTSRSRGRQPSLPPSLPYWLPPAFTYSQRAADLRNKILPYFLKYATAL